MTLKLDDILDAPLYLPKFKNNEVKIIKVIDGDSFHVVGITQDENCYRFVCRLRNVDTPEIRGPYHETAIQVKDVVEEKYLHKIVQISNIGRDKYGRILCDLSLDNTTISDWLIQNNYAKQYYGGKKED